MTETENEARSSGLGDQFGAPTRVQFTIAGNIRSRSVARRTDFVDALATVLRTRPQLIRQHAVYAGSLSDAARASSQRPLLKQWVHDSLGQETRRVKGAIIIDLSLSAESAHRLRALVRDNSAQLDHLRLRKVVLASKAGIKEE